MSEQTPGELREFSKTHAPQERIEVAQKVLEVRRNSVERKTELNSLLQSAEAKKLESSEVIEEIESIEDEIRESRSSAFNTLLNTFKLRSLEEKLRTAKNKRNNIETECSSLFASVSELQDLLHEQKGMDGAREVLAAFYEKQDENWNSYQEKLRTSDVSEISRELGVTFVHAIRPDTTPGENSLLHPWASWQQKLDVLLSLEPTISASTVNEDRSSMWGRMGVILNGGRVTDASARDMGSVAQGVKKRITHGNHTDSLTERISKAISGREGHGYNEILVEDPQIAGFYISPESDSSLSDLVAEEEIYEYLKETGIKVFILKNGVPYESEYDPMNKVYVEKEPVGHQIYEEKYLSSEEDRNLALERLMTDSPFKITSPEVQFIESRASGRKLYLNLLNPGNGTEMKEATFDFGKHNSGVQIPKGSSIRLLAEYPGVGNINRYFLFDGKSYIQRIDSHTGESYTLANESLSNGAKEIDYIHIGFGTYDLGLPLADAPTYLRAMSDAIPLLKNTIVEAENERNEFRVALWSETLQKLAFHLHGFSEQAEAFGDSALADEARKMATEIVSEIEFKEILERRIDTSGKLRITKEDIPGIA